MRHWKHWLMGALVLFGAGSARGATVDEWVLPSAASKPVEIDAAHGAIEFIDANNSTFNQLDPVTNRLTTWQSALFSYGGPGSIQVYADPTLGKVAFATSAPLDRIVRVSTSPARMAWWQMTAPLFGGPHALSVDAATGDVWFVTYDGVHQPVIAKLVPATKVVTFWLIPPAVATPTAHIDGVVFFASATGPKVYFSLAGNGAVAILDPVANRFTRYPWRTAGPGQIAVNAAGDVFAPQGGGAGAALRLRPSTSTSTEWVTGASSFAPYIALDTAGTGYLTGTLSGTPNVSGLNPAIAGINVVVSPTVVPAVSNTQTAISDAGTPTVTITPLAHGPSASVPVVSGAYTRFAPTTATGAVSAETPTAIWFTETIAHRVARLKP